MSTLLHRSMFYGMHGLVFNTTVKAFHYTYYYYIKASQQASVCPECRSLSWPGARSGHGPTKPPLSYLLSMLHGSLKKQSNIYSAAYTTIQMIKENIYFIPVIEFIFKSYISNKENWANQKDNILNLYKMGVNCSRFLDRFLIRLWLFLVFLFSNC